MYRERDSDYMRLCLKAKVMSLKQRIIKQFFSVLIPFE